MGKTPAKFFKMSLPLKSVGFETYVALIDVFLIFNLTVLQITT